MLLRNTAARLITINHKLDNGDIVSYDILPGDNPAVSVPDEHCESDFVKAMIDNGSLVALREEAVSDPADDLRAEAEALGIKVHHLWKADRLRKEIDAVKAKAE
ncbi:MAG: hypothetical protein ACREA9_16055 [Pyrinomonadaceae bacterium]